MKFEKLHKNRSKQKECINVPNAEGKSAVFLIAVWLVIQPYGARNVVKISVRDNIVAVAA